jgi:hypothetical protein
VQKIVQDHGGEISVQRTAPGKTVFMIVLPARLPESLPADPIASNVASLVPASQEDADHDPTSHPGA